LVRTLVQYPSGGRFPMSGYHEANQDRQGTACYGFHHLKAPDFANQRPGAGILSVRLNGLSNNKVGMELETRCALLHRGVQTVSKVSVSSKATRDNLVPPHGLDPQGVAKTLSYGLSRK
jgi:hypothetical protein